MKDLVERQAAIEKLISNLTYMHTFGADRSIDLIEELPSAQPDIIRCSECKHWREDHTCREHSLVSPMMANEFCSRAERR